MLEVDGGERGRELAHVADRGADQAVHVAKGPTRWGNRLVTVGHKQRACVVAAGLNPQRPDLDSAGDGTICAGADGVVQGIKGEEALVVGPAEVLRGDASDPPRQLSRLLPAPGKPTVLLR